MSADIETRRAEITSASVTIRMMHVDGRKLTLATFRQIPEAPFFSVRYGVPVRRGIPWGWVEYWWDGQSSFVHLLWQDGETLRRALHKMVLHGCECASNPVKYANAFKAAMEEEERTKKYATSKYSTERSFYANAVNNAAVAKRVMERFTSYACTFCAATAHLSAPLNRVIDGRTFGDWWNDELRALKSSVPQLFIAT